MNRAIELLNELRSVCFGGDGTSTTQGAVKGQDNRLDVAGVINRIQEEWLAEQQLNDRALDGARGARDAYMIAGFKRGALFRETTNGMVDLTNSEIVEKVADYLKVPR